MATRAITLKVIGEREMQCAGCENAVKAALKKLPGILNVEASHQTQNVDVTYDPDKVGVDNMKAALLKAGYQADAA